MAVPFSRLHPVSLPQEIDLDSILSPGGLGILSNLEPSELTQWSRKVASTDIKDSAGIVPSGKYFVDFTVDDKKIAGGLTTPIYIILNYTNDGGVAERTPDRLTFLRRLNNIIATYNSQFGPGRAYWAPPGSINVNTAPTSLFAEHLQLSIEAAKKNIIPGSGAHVRIEPDKYGIILPSDSDINDLSGNPDSLPPLNIRKKHQFRSKKRAKGTSRLQATGSTPCYSNIEISVIMILAVSLTIAIMIVVIKGSR